MQSLKGEICSHRLALEQLGTICRWSHKEFDFPVVLWCEEKVTDGERGERGCDWKGSGRRGLDQTLEYTVFCHTQSLVRRIRHKVVNLSSLHNVFLPWRFYLQTLTALEVTVVYLNNWKGRLEGLCWVFFLDISSFHICCNLRWRFDD